MIACLQRLLGLISVQIMLLMMETYLPGPTREKIVVAHYRKSGQANIDNFDDIVRLCRSTGYVMHHCSIMMHGRTQSLSCLPLILLPAHPLTPCLPVALLQVRAWCEQGPPQELPRELLRAVSAAAGADSPVHRPAPVG